MTAHYAEDRRRSASLTETYDVISTAFLTPSLTNGNRSNLMRVQETTQQVITRKLTEAFAPESLRVVDESEQHVGHSGHRAGGETHFRIYIVTPAFKDKSRLERHRMINQTLSSELTSGIHALAIHAAAPGENAT
jgi:BolA family transcriptional regulator, general stress-responsive regulator